MKDSMNRLTTRISSLLVLTAVWFTLSHCTDSDKPVPPQPEIMVKAVMMGSYTSASLKAFIPLAGLDINPDLLQYDVEVYIVSYKTTYKGVVITASGLAGLPRSSASFSMLSVHHGTITDNLSAPSASTYFGLQAVLCAAFSSMGFVAVMPDYIGYGDSKDLLHPYYVEALSASAVIDNLKAVRELAEIKSVSVSKDLFLSGYSEGGYATMAVHKFLDQNPMPEFNLVASFPAAGGYNIKEMQEHVFGLETFADPYYLAFLTHAYNTTYEWGQPLTDFFDQPYANRIPGLFTGSLSGSQINEELTTSVDELLTTEILTGINSNPKYTNFVNALSGNSLTNWTPIKPMYMYHGDADETVPYANSVSVYNQLIINGANPDNLKLITLPGATHGSGLVPYIEDVVAKLVVLD